jgi:hypothetical protein
LDAAASTAPNAEKALYIQLGLDKTLAPKDGHWANNDAENAFKAWIKNLEDMMKFCCNKYPNEFGMMCNAKIKVATDFDVTNKPSPADPRNPSYNDDDDQEKLSKGLKNIKTKYPDGIRVMMTQAQIVSAAVVKSANGTLVPIKVGLGGITYNTKVGNTGEIIPTESGTVITVKPGVEGRHAEPDPNTLSHELGHRAGYDKGDIDNNSHSSDRKNLMHPSSKAADTPDHCWCDKISKLLK